MASPTNVPAWAWWTERLTIGVVVADLAATAAGAAGVPGARATVAALTGAAALTLIVVLVRISPVRRRLGPLVSADRARRGDRRLAGRLLDGGLVEATERPLVGRLAWSILAGNIVTAWVDTVVAGGAAAGMFDGRGDVRWGWGWPAVSSATVVLVLAVLVVVARESARWRRIAGDPDLTEAPTATAPPAPGR